ncbi:Phosphate regulon transcriptional regulatory protein PhoB (SphR) [Cyanobacterium sp. HL-69]|uniref:response regulator transcription factor n=1 Tax=Cyanobacterium sp. HL-69 TaxID=2054282 RepID=UPI000CA0E69A|nr:Phosphate regulon transcriptional regulatory protein PhoB (SphR) [Cyanobacterium sp. HL-69]
MEILIVEDENEIAQLINSCLTREGFHCSIVYDGVSALEKAKEIQPDLILLDLMLPKLDGLEVCNRLRNQPLEKDPYILMLTAKGEEIDRIVGLSTGADDYLVKPFSTRELVARVRALLRRSLRHGAMQQAQIYQTSHFSVNLDEHTATRQLEGEKIEELDLTALELNLLCTFVSYPHKVWSRTQLIDKLWGADFFGDERVVDTHIRRLRKKIEINPAQPIFLKTVVGIGYKFED